MKIEQWLKDNDLILEVSNTKYSGVYSATIEHDYEKDVLFPDEMCGYSETEEDSIQNLINKIAGKKARVGVIDVPVELVT